MAHSGRRSAAASERCIEHEYIHTGARQRLGTRRTYNPRANYYSIGMTRHGRRTVDRRATMLITPKTEFRR
jgi:hypothetical protein